MKIELLLLVLFANILTIFSQSSLDSLKLVLPVGHTSHVHLGIFSPDGKLALTSSSDGTARVYEIKSGKELYVLRGHFDGVEMAQFSNDGKKIITIAGRDKRAFVWDCRTGNLVDSLIGHNQYINFGCFSPNNQKIITAGRDSTVRFWDVNSLKEIQRIDCLSGEVNSIAFHPEGSIFAIGTENGIVQLWDLSTSKIIRTLYGNQDRINKVMFSPNGEKILTSSRGGDVVLIWDVATGILNDRIEIASRNAELAIFNPFSDKILVPINKNSLSLYDLSTKEIIYDLTGHTSFINDVTFSNDGNLIITGSADNTTRLWEAKTGKPIQIFKDHSASVQSVQFSSDDKYIITTGGLDKSAIIYDVNSRKKRFILKGKSISVETAHFNNETSQVISSSRDANSAFTFDLKTGQSMKNLLGHSEYVIYAAFDKNDNLAVTTSWDETAKIWDLKSGKEINTFYGHEHTVNSAVFSPCGNFIVTASRDATSRLWDVNSGKELRRFTGHTSGVNTASFSPDGKKVITASQDHTVRIWDVETGKQIQVLTGHEWEVYSAKFSQDMKKILTSGVDRTIRIWDAETGKQTQILTGHKWSVKSATFHPHRNEVLSSSFDGTARIFQLDNLKEINLSDTISEILESGEYNSDGKFILTIGQDNKTILWNRNPLKRIFERIQMKNENWILKLPNSPYYMGSKDASKMLHYVTPSFKVIGFEQLDPVYNRPDIVLDSINKYFKNEDRGMIDEYRKFWEKRIDRLGLDKEKLSNGEIAVPEAEIVDADRIAFVNKDGNVTIHVKADDPKYTLRRFNVFINEVPLYGSSGISIAHLRQQRWDTTLTIPLSLGENKIQVSVLNELGLENFKYPTYVQYNPDNKSIVAKTHYIGIGVNEFQEKKHNLTYCVKDVNDLGHVFSGENNAIKLLTEHMVTRENIVGLRQYLKDSTTIHDKVIISCSSHGLLDDSLNFYLATHDTDFNDPKTRGVRYEELEGLLDGIPARQKLLLLDACNSGENDKTELLKKSFDQEQILMDSTQLLAARGEIIRLEEVNKSNFKKMHELFVNVRNNTGSVIISAAGGQESALEAIILEGEQIKNGAFTYSVLEYLRIYEDEKEALTVNKLKQYVENRVEQITQGKQKPTSRQETMEVDWSLK